MGRQRERKGAPAAEGGLAPGIHPIDTGTCELVPDRFNPNGWVLHINGVPSSHIDTADPARLDFEYMRWINSLVTSQWPSSQRLRVLHLGGGACSLARSFAVSFPEARQVVVELDGELARLVREWFDLPRAPLLRIRVGEARAVTETLSENSRDLIIRDVFAGSRTPLPLTTREFLGHAHRVLDAGGVYVVNCGDSPDLSMAKREAATISEAFAHTVIIADPPMLKGRRYGNVIIAGSDAPLGEDPALARELLGGGVPAQLWSGEQVARFGRGAQILTD
ncbi:spermidine synthase [Arthrobacter sp. JZ12]|uniref:spermidine synthase n=1 Tax=Arthrobacter sp. JZ12 TaxID=2654190 RepID=UPI002B46E57A|nr:fused MFS/spermidine synthase [Arthrobacter sp. JZ12]WRH23793.1 spermidine synthase [Arthrobacter sp. JZ12]